MWTTMGIRFDITYTVKELSRVLQEPTKIAGEILERTLNYVTQSKDAFLAYNPDTMINYELPATRKIPHAQKDIYDTHAYNHHDDIPHHDDKPTLQTYTYKGPKITTTCYTDIDLAGQHETRQSTSGYLLYLNGALVHWHGRTERLIIKSTAAGEYIALSRGHAACQFMKTILQFYGNQESKAYLFTDNQAAEHIATKPTMNEHSRSIDIRHHAVRQDYLEGNVQIRGVKTTENPSDILTKFLPAPTHMKHASPLNIQSHVKNIEEEPTPTKMQANTTIYTQNGNHISNPIKPNQKAQHPTYRRISNSLPTRRPHTLSSVINDIPTTRRRQRGRARVRLHQPTIDVLRRRPSLPATYKTGRLNRQRNHKHKQRRTPGYVVPGSELASATTRQQTLHRKIPDMCAPQHIPPQAHHAPINKRNNMPRNTHRQQRKPPPRHLYQPLQDNKVRMVSVDHSLLENHQKHHRTHTRATRVLHTTWQQNNERQRVDKWIRTYLPPPPPAATSSKLSHPFAFKQIHQPTATTMHTRCNCKTNLTRGQIESPRNKNIETQNQYNFSQTYPNQRRKRPSCPKHIDQSDKHKRQPQFQTKPHEPITNTRNPSTIPRAQDKRDEIDKMAKQKPRIQSTNENRRINPAMQLQPQTNQKVFPVKYRTNSPANQKEPAHRNKTKSPNETKKTITKTIDLYKVPNNAFTEIAGDNVLIVKRVKRRRRRPRSCQHRRVNRGIGHVSTSILPTPPPHPHRASTKTSQQQILRGQEASKMRIERYELRNLLRTHQPKTTIRLPSHQLRVFQKRQSHLGPVS